jgi:integrase
MPVQKRHKTKYPGVYYIEGKAVGKNGKERIYYVMYRKKGKQIHEKAGRQYQDDMTAARAAQIRARRIEGREPTNKERRKAEKSKKAEQENRWTIDRLFWEYIKTRPENKGRSVDIGRYHNYIKPQFGDKEPNEILALDVDRLRFRLQKELAPQTVKHVLNLLTWIINFGKKKNLCKGISFHIQKPTVHNEKTEDLSDEQLRTLIKTIDESINIQIKNFIKLVLFTGMRRGEVLKLKWEDINLDSGFINIRDPKGGPDQKIPLNDATRNVLEFHPREDSPYVFPGRGGGQRVSVQAGVNKIKKLAGLPKDFRPLHGLRHVYASMLASSGKVDMYTLQRLLTHKDARMTQRYAHLRDEALHKASGLAVNLINDVTKEKDNSIIKELTP